MPGTLDTWKFISDMITVWPTKYRPCSNRVLQTDVDIPPRDWRMSIFRHETCLSWSRWFRKSVMDLKIRELQYRVVWQVRVTGDDVHADSVATRRRVILGNFTTTGLLISNLLEYLPFFLLSVSRCCLGSKYSWKEGIILWKYKNPNNNATVMFSFEQDSKIRFETKHRGPSVVRILVLVRMIPTFQNPVRN